jgi:hypothetical protein
MVAVSLVALVLIVCGLWFFRPARHRVIDVLVSDNILEDRPGGPPAEGRRGAVSAPADTPMYGVAAETGEAAIWGVEAESPLQVDTAHLFGPFLAAAKTAIIAQKAEAAAAARLDPRMERPAAASPFGRAPEPLFQSVTEQEAEEAEGPQVIELPPLLGGVTFGMGEADVRTMFDISSHGSESDGPHEVLVLVHQVRRGSNAETVRFYLTQDSLYRVEVRLRPAEGQTLGSLLETWQQRFRKQYRGYPMAEAYKWSDGVVRLRVGKKTAGGYVWIEYLCRRARPPALSREGEVE